MRSKEPIQDLVIDYDTANIIVALKEDIKRTSREIILWMFFFWIANMITTIGLILLFLKR